MNYYGIARSPDGETGSRRQGGAFELDNFGGDEMLGRVHTRRDTYKAAYKHSVINETVFYYGA